MVFLQQVHQRFPNGIYYGYYIVGAAFIAQFVAIGMYSYVLGSFMAPMIDELGWSHSDFTLTRTIGQCVMALVGVFVGVRVDRYGGRPIMLLGPVQHMPWCQLPSAGRFNLTRAPCHRIPAGKCQSGRRGPHLPEGRAKGRAVCL